MLLVDELVVPRLADAEGVHGADLHVGHHLRRRHDDGLRRPCPGRCRRRRASSGSTGRACRRGRSWRPSPPCRAFFFSSAFLSGAASTPSLRSSYSLATEIAWPLRFSRARMYIGTGWLFCVTLPVGDQVGHRRQDVRAVDAAAFAAEHEVVARGAPRRLLQHLDIGHAVLGEEALLLGDDQRRRVGERDEAELGFRDLGAGGLRE